MAKILVIDSSHRNRTQVERILRLRTDHTVVLAEDGAEAFERLRASLPDVILLDLFLPRVDGFHVYRVLKERPATARIPIILSIAVSLDPMTEARARQLKVEGRLEMPVTSSELIEVISLVLIQQKAALTLEREAVEGSPGVAKVQWPRVERPAPPPEAELEPERPREVKPVAWPKAGSRQDRGSGGAKREAEENPPAPSTTPSLKGRDYRARLAMMATGQAPPDGGESVSQDEEARREEPSKGLIGEGFRTNPAPHTPRKPAREKPPPEPTHVERVQALLRFVGQPEAPAPEPAAQGFQSLPIARADPARVIDHTRKSREAGADDRQEQGAPQDPPQKKPSPSKAKDRQAAKEGPGTAVRPVQWTQIRKKD